MLVEICASTYQSAINAQKAGAHRIELCADLSVGGLTPNYDLTAQLVRDMSIPINVLIRPRKGNFVYSDNEFEQMLIDIDHCKKLGCHGIVSGVLNSDNTIDIDRTSQFIARSHPLEFTFHRAFDSTPDAHMALKDLILMGVDRILTSGHSETAQEGLLRLCQLKKVSQDKLTILVGGSVRATNINVFKKKGFDEVHSSALLPYSRHSDLDEIRNLVKLAES